MLGSLTREEAAMRLEAAVNEFSRSGISLSINGQLESIQPETAGFDVDLAQALDMAFERGRGGPLTARLWDSLTALWRKNILAAPVRVDQPALERRIEEIASRVSSPRKDIRLEVKGGGVSLLTDTAPGHTIDRVQAAKEVTTALQHLDGSTIVLSLKDDPPQADPATGQPALQDARKLMARGLNLQYEDSQFFISRERIGSWIVSEYQGSALRAGLDRTKIAQYIDTTVAAALNVEPQAPSVSTTDGRVVGFLPAKVGRVVEQQKLIEDIIGTLQSRTGQQASADTIVVPVHVSKMALTGLDEASGIRELVGKATTPFTGSPKNRISNIKNGVKYLSGVVIEPGAEFSTLGALGTIDNTTGYLPELVIKGDRTTPEFGGGLCQVSTTLFRAALDAGLPITARRNHSFRISYYEKDGTGKFIGPGLDATIYEPDIDFKFLNDTGNPLLVIGYVIGDKLTFEFYGTHDGRNSHVSTPKLLSEISPGEPVYIETANLAPGVTKQIEVPHPGGSTVATYTVTYPGGIKKTQEFKSYYRRWPAKFLVGVSSPTSPPNAQ